MSQPGLLSNIIPEEGLAAVWAELRQLRELVGQMQTAKVGNRLAVDGAPGIIVKNGGGIAVQGGGSITLDGGDLSVVDGDITLDGGDLIANDGVLRSENFLHGSTGWRLQPGGNVEVNDITIRGGIIGNDALTDPVSPRAPHADATGFNISKTGFTVPAEVTVPVPSGYSSALVIAIAQGGGYNNLSALEDQLYVAARIDGVVPPGWAAETTSVDNQMTNAVAAGTKLLTGLGASFTIGCAMRSFSFNWTDGAFNTANIDAIVLFLR